MGMINVHDININLDDNCNDCCPCIPSKKVKPAQPKEGKQTDQKKIDLNEKVDKSKCSIL